MFPTSSNPPASGAVAPLQTMQRLPQNVALPMIPVLETKKKVELKAPTTAAVVPPAASQKPPEGFSPPALEKTVKPVKAVPVSQASRPAESLRPTWPDHTQNAPNTTTYPAASTRVENPANLFIITCDVSNGGLNSEEDAGRGRRILHAIYDYAKVMELQGNSLTEKLVTYVVNTLIPTSVPPLVRAGIGMGTIEVKVSYPANVTGNDLVATIDILSASNATIRYRTLTIRRFRSNSLTNLDL